MRFLLPKLPKRFKLPSPKGDWHKGSKTDLKTGAKYLWAGMLMAGSTETASHLVNRDQKLGDNSEVVTLEDWGPSILRVDSMEASTQGR